MTTVFVCKDFIVADRVLTRGDETIHADFKKLHVNSEKTIAIAVVGNVNFRDHHKMVAKHFFGVIKKRYTSIPAPVLTKSEAALIGDLQLYVLTAKDVFVITKAENVQWVADGLTEGAGTGYALACAAFSLGAKPEHIVPLVSKIDPMSSTAFNIAYRVDLKPITLKA
ncbi:hypothetical protein PHOBOS_123 [Erwinia phage vB_EamM_Phobos]|uniref:peptidase HslV family n=1 Tax=Erwinia phage vB_EamM_Phobos TaxID=1883377 RepID=UPI00081D1E72|nr:peptidase HslV family [Erwinia phage vB_EamM_Phobos]ANZ50313.1 hypothetical protein PHOBOS_123 [Erwinia phage vB_EamM_Phobos]